VALRSIIIIILQNYLFKLNISIFWAFDEDILSKKMNLIFVIALNLGYPSDDTECICLVNGCLSIIWLMIWINNMMLLKRGLFKMAVQVGHDQNNMRRFYK